MHFSSRILLRSGWGPSPRQGAFGTKNFSRYYLNFTQLYSVYLFALMCRTFRRELALGPAFMVTLKHLRHSLDEQLRWPEAVTYEEMNQQGPDSLLRAFFQAFHEQKTRPEERRRVLKALIALGQVPPSDNASISKADSDARRRRILIPMIRAEMRRRERQKQSRLSSGEGETRSGPAAATERPALVTPNARLTLPAASKVGHSAQSVDRR